MYEFATLVMLLKSDGKTIDIYLGTVCKKTDDTFVPQKQITALVRNFEANFPGSEVQEVADSNERMRIVQSIFEKNLCVAAKAVKIIKCLTVVKVIVAVFAFGLVIKNTICAVR